MAHAILSSAKHGAYLAIGLYVALVLVVSLGAEYQGLAEASLQASRPAVAHEHQATAAAAGQGAVTGAVGA